MSDTVKPLRTMTQDIQITTTDRKSLITTTNPFEQNFGYHRAVRRGPFIAVSGTTALKLHSELNVIEDESVSGVGVECDSKVHHPDDAYNQALLSLDRAVDAVACLGGQIEDIMRVRMFVARSKDCEIVGAAFRQRFGMHKDEKGRVDVVGVAATMIVVPGGFVEGGMLVEVEVDAYVL